MKYLFQFDSFEKMVLSRSHDDRTITVSDAVDYGREFFNLGYEEVSERLNTMNNEAVRIEDGKIYPLNDGVQA